MQDFSMGPLSCELSHSISFPQCLGLYVVSKQSTGIRRPMAHGEHSHLSLLAVEALFQLGHSGVSNAIFIGPLRASVQVAGTRICARS